MGETSATMMQNQIMMNAPTPEKKAYFSSLQENIKAELELKKEKIATEHAQIKIQKQRQDLEKLRMEVEAADLRARLAQDREVILIGDELNVDKAPDISQDCGELLLPAGGPCDYPGCKHKHIWIDTCEVCGENIVHYVECQLAWAQANMSGDDVRDENRKLCFGCIVRQYPNNKSST